MLNPNNQPQPQLAALATQHDTALAPVPRRPRLLPDTVLGPAASLVLGPSLPLPLPLLRPSLVLELPQPAMSAAARPAVTLLLLLTVPLVRDEPQLSSLPSLRAPTRPVAPSAPLASPKRCVVMAVGKWHGGQCEQNNGGRHAHSSARATLTHPSAIKSSCCTNDALRTRTRTPTTQRSEPPHTSPHHPSH
jgi:hypothetical protein